LGDRKTILPVKTWLKQTPPAVLVFKKSLEDQKLLSLAPKKLDGRTESGSGSSSSSSSKSTSSGLVILLSVRTGEQEIH